MWHLVFWAKLWEGCHLGMLDLRSKVALLYTQTGVPSLNRPQYHQSHLSELSSTDIFFPGAQRETWNIGYKKHGEWTTIILNINIRFIDSLDPRGVNRPALIQTVKVCLTGRTSHVAFSCLPTVYTQKTTDVVTDGLLTHKRWMPKTQYSCVFGIHACFYGSILRCMCSMCAWLQTCIFQKYSKEHVCSSFIRAFLCSE